MPLLELSAPWLLVLEEAPLAAARVEELVAAAEEALGVIAAAEVACEVVEVCT